MSAETNAASGKKEESPGNINGVKLVRRILEMVAILHERGYQSLYIHPGMAGHGGSWRYRIGVMESGAWPVPNDKLLVTGWVIGGADYELEWADGMDDPATLADKFIARYGAALAAARTPNPKYAAWHCDVLERTRPDGIVVFWCSGIEDYEYVFTWNNTSVKFPMPPGFDKERL
jgi:hypothetical protein